MSMYGVPYGPTVTDPESGRAKQAFKDECDINMILKRHKAGATSTHVNQNAGRYADVSEVGDYRSAIERVRAADKFFAGLSDKVRGAFDYDAAIFLDAVADPEQVEFLTELGLLPLVEPAVPAVVEPPLEAKILEPVVPAPAPEA